MSRDHCKLRVFHDAHSLTVAIYKHTRNFPKDEWFGIRAQIRRAAVSVPSKPALSDIQRRCTAVVKQLERLTQTMEAAAEKAKSNGRRSP